MPTTQPIYLTWNQQPREIIRRMDELVLQRGKLEQTSQRTKQIVTWLFLGGLPFILIDLLVTFVLGYRMCLFSFITPITWIAALVLYLQARSRQMGQYPENYGLVRQLLYVLRDDGDPRRPFFGHLDLTGTQQPSKVARKVKDRLGRVVEYFRDDWLDLKVKLYDGNMLRLATIRREKQRKGYYGRGRVSGKSKWKPPKFKGAEDQLRVRLSVNPVIYDIGNRAAVYPGLRIGVYQIEEVEISGGIINLTATATGKLRVEDILTVLKQLYQMLKRKDQP